MEYYHQALPLYQQVKDKDGEGTVLANFGLLYADLADKERAITYYNQALPLFKAINKQSSVAVVLNNLGQAYSDLADFNKALEYFRQSLSLRRQVEDRVGEGTVLLNIGAIYLEQRQPQEALKSFKTALPLFRQAGRKREEANILVGMGRVFDEIKQPEKALNFYRQALPLYRSVGDRSGEATALNNVAFVERDRGNLQAAIQNVEKAVAIIEDLRTKISHEDLRTSYFATQQHTYNLYIDLLMRLHQQQPQRGYDALALHAKLPSASTIAIKRRQLAQRQPAPKAIAIIADPVYNHHDERLTGKPGNNPLAPELELERTALQRSAKSLNRNGWDRLPGTQQEAKAILNMVPGDQTLSAFGFDANYNLATSKNLNQYRILHFATHGFVNEQQPELSGIVLSLLDPQGNQIPGYLRLGDLFNQDYPAELIVLSACETGLGKNVSGEGLVGLTRGLMYAGAARVLVSSWQVSDAGTAVLMEEFYRQMLKEKKTPTQALQIAQRRLWENPQWRSPFYWGAFSLQGEWR